MLTKDQGKKAQDGKGTAEQAKKLLEGQKKICELSDADVENAVGGAGPEGYETWYDYKIDLFKKGSLQVGSCPRFESIANDPCTYCSNCRNYVKKGWFTPAECRIPGWPEEYYSPLKDKKIHP